MIKEAIGKVVSGQDLSETEMIEVMNQIMGGEATPAQVGSFITALRMKGETIDEIAGAARVMRDHATPIRVGKAVDIDREEINLDRETILDTCGTGGSGTRSSKPCRPPAPPSPLPSISITSSTRPCPFVIWPNAWE